MIDLVDVTLREGQQRPGRSYSVGEKVAAARRLDALGLDYLQVGFPAADDGTAEVCARLDVDAKITGIARAIEGDIAATEAAGVDVIGVFAPTSDRTREAILGVDRDELRSMAGEAVDRARETGREVRFGALDGFRTDPDFLSDLHADLPATYFNVSDTVGVGTPPSVAEHLAAIGDLDSVGVHFHDDLGLATANALAAADAGAGKVDVAVGGLGERAGNTPLEEFVAAAAVGGHGIETGVDEGDLLPAARGVLDALSERVPERKPLLGEDAFRHESGLHTAAMLDDPATFEAFDPARFGGRRRLVFGSDTGRGAATRLLDRAGVEPTEAAVTALLDALDDLDEPVGLDGALDLAAAVDADAG